MSESTLEIQKVEVDTPHCGKLQAFTHGSSTNIAILTVHDLGCNHTQYTNFLQHVDMEPITKRFMWIHIQLPGQGDHEEDLPSDFKFPTMQEIAEDLILVLDHLNVRNVVLFGEGAGANVLARFAMLHDERALGIILIHIVGTSESFFARTTRRISVTSKLSNQGSMTTSAEEYLTKHRFGTIKESSHQELKDGVEAYKASLNSSINAKNLNQYIISFMNRSNIKDKIVELRCPVLFLTGTKASHNGDVAELHYALQRALESEPARRTKVELLQIAGVANVLVETPEKVAESILYFIQGLGLGGALVSRRMSTTVQPASPPPTAGSVEHRSRSLSMEERDQPRGKEYYEKVGSIDEDSHLHEENKIVEENVAC